MRILKILLISACLGTFGATTTLAATAPLATTGEPSAKPKAKKAKKTVVKAKKPKKKVYAAKTTKLKKKPASTDTETAPGNPPPGSNPN